MTKEQIDNLWRANVAPLYGKHPRNRAYALTEDSRRHLVELWRACNDATDRHSDATKEMFEWAVEAFSAAGCNILQPKPPQPPSMPDWWKDPWGHELPNPFVTKDLKGQTLFLQRAPELAKWAKLFAEDPIGAYVAWQDAEAATAKATAFTYNADTHAANPWARNTTVTERSKFEKEHPDLVERLKLEGAPVAFPFGKHFNLTLQSAIQRTPKLAGLFDSMQLRERAHVEEAKAASQAAIEQAKKTLEELEAARS
jgi:hypothetical protein